MQDDDRILNEIKNAIRKFANAEVVDMDAYFVHKFDFQVFRFEDVLASTNRYIPPHKWSYHRITFIKQGSGEYITGIYRYPATKNTLVVIPARVITSSRNWAPDAAGYVLLFNVDFFLQSNFPYHFIEGKRILTSLFQPNIQLNDEQGKEVEDIFETILREKDSNHSYRDELIALKIIELLIISERVLERDIPSSTGAPAIDLVKRFSELLETNITNERSVAFYASALNVHPNYLNLLIKKHTGLTAKESIQNRLLLEAKYLLHSTTLSIKEISNKLSFNDPNYFTVFFKRFEKISPANYRSSVFENQR